MNNTIYYLSLLVLLSTLIYVSFIDLKERRVKFNYWYPTIIVGTISTLYFIYNNYQTFDLMTNIILITVVIIFYICGRIKLIGGADAWALIFITIFSISIPFNSLLNNIHTGIGVSTYINALILSFIIYPFYNYMYNFFNGIGKKVPLYYMFFAQRIKGKDILNKFGYIIPFDNYVDLDVFIKLYKSKDKLYTKTLMDNQELYINEIYTYKEKSYIWIFNAVPFIVYITIGFIITITIGDIYNYIVGIIL